MNIYIYLWLGLVILTVLIIYKLSNKPIYIKINSTFIAIAIGLFITIYGFIIATNLSRTIWHKAFYTFHLNNSDDVILGYEANQDYFGEYWNIKDIDEKWIHKISTDSVGLIEIKKYSFIKQYKENHKREQDSIFKELLFTSAQIFYSKVNEDNVKVKKLIFKTDKFNDFDSTFRVLELNNLTIYRVDELISGKFIVKYSVDVDDTMVEKEDILVNYIFNVNEQLFEEWNTIN